MIILLGGRETGKRNELMSFPPEYLGQFDGLRPTLERKDLHNFDNLGYNVQILIFVVFLSPVIYLEVFRHTKHGRNCGNLSQKTHFLKAAISARELKPD